MGLTVAVIFTCNVQSVLFSRNSTNRFTTPGVLITSSMGGFGSGENNQELLSLA